MLNEKEKPAKKLQGQHIKEEVKSEWVRFTELKPANLIKLWRTVVRGLLKENEIN